MGSAERVVQKRGRQEGPCLAALSDHILPSPSREPLRPAQTPPALRDPIPSFPADQTWREGRASQAGRAAPKHAGQQAPRHTSARKSKAPRTLPPTTYGSSCLVCATRHRDSPAQTMTGEPGDTSLYASFSIRNSWHFHTLRSALCRDTQRHGLRTHNQPLLHWVLTVSI